MAKEDMTIHIKVDTAELERASALFKAGFNDPTIEALRRLIVSYRYWLQDAYDGTDSPDLTLEADCNRLDEQAKTLGVSIDKPIQHEYGIRK